MTPSFSKKQMNSEAIYNTFSNTHTCTETHTQARNQKSTTLKRKAPHTKLPVAWQNEACTQNTVLATRSLWNGYASFHLPFENIYSTIYTMDSQWEFDV